VSVQPLFGGSSGAPYADIAGHAGQERRHRTCEGGQTVQDGTDVAREKPAASVTPEQFFEATDEVCCQNGIRIESVGSK